MPKLTEEEWRDFEQAIGYAVRDYGAVVPRTGMWIKGHLLLEGSDWVWNMYKQFRAFARSVPFNPGQYHTFRTYFYVCRAVDLLEEDHREPGEVDMRKNERIFYRVVEDQVMDDAWVNPFRAYRLMLAERGYVKRPELKIEEKEDVIVIRKDDKEVRVRVGKTD